MHRIIQTKAAKRNSEETWFVYDTETPGLQANKPLLFCFKNIRNGSEYTFFTREDARRFIESNAPAVAYAHNGNSFDIFGMLSPEEIYNSKKITANTKIFEVEHNGVKYRDSKHLFPMSLDGLGKTVGVEKGETPMKFIDGHINGRELTIDDIDDNDIEYCLQDVRVLAAAILQFEELFAELVKQPSSMVSLPLTTASAAYKAWCVRSWPQHWYWTDARKRVRPIATGHKIFNESFRSAEAGGMVRLLNCEPGKMITDGVISYDRNSMYPAEMVKRTYPDLKNIGHVGASFAALEIELEREDRVCAAKLKMRTLSDDAYLGLPNINELGRRDWNRTSFDGWLCEPEIEFALENGWGIESIDEIVSGKAIKPFNNYIDLLYKKRLEMKEQNNPAEKLCKLLMNSLFGRFGIKEKPIRVDGSDLETLEMEPNYEELLETGMIERGYYDGIGGAWPYVLDNRELLKTPSSQWFGFSSFILSYARANLGKAIVSVGDAAIYTDTDSVHFRKEAEEKFVKAMPVGKNLGDWDLETPKPIKNCIYWEPKVYVHMNEQMQKTLVKHKGIKVRNVDGSFKDDAGDLTKEQTHKTVLSFYDALRRGMQPGSELVTKKRSTRFFKDT